jgi:hypothetical protein
VVALIVFSDNSILAVAGSGWKHWRVDWTVKGPTEDIFLYNPSTEFRSVKELMTGVGPWSLSKKSKTASSSASSDFILE